MIHLICPNPAIDRTLLFKHLEYAIPNRPLEVRESPGGKSFNVAYSATFDSQEPLLIHTMLGGEYGVRVEKLAQLKEYPIIKTAIEENTRLCNILVDTTTSSILPIYEKGFSLKETQLSHFTQKLIETVQERDFLVFSGSFMKNMPNNYISQTMKLLKKQSPNVSLCVDTSGEALVETYQTAQPYLIKINDEEVRDLFPTKVLETIEDYLDLFKNDVDPAINYFVITLGKAGVVARGNGLLYYGKAEAVEAKNPIASGDFFLGRLVKGLIHEDNFEDILADALLFSTANVLNWFPEVTKEQLAIIKPTITVKRMM